MLFAIAALALQAGAPQTPTVNRSGEAALKELLQSMGSIDSGRMIVHQCGRESATASFMPSFTIDAQWAAGGKRRIEFSDMWGSGMRYVSDGKTVLKDYMDVSSGVALVDFDKSIQNSVPDLAFKGSYQVVSLYFLEGESALEKLAPKEASILVSGNTIQLTKSAIGNATIYWTEMNKRKVVTEIEFDNWDRKQSDHEQMPDWIDAPQPGTLDVETIQYVFRSAPNKDAFDTQPPKGLNVADERKGPKKPPLKR